MKDRNTPAGEDDTDDAVKAFEALRKAIDKRGAATAAELKTIRQGVEALFDQVESLQARPDYTADLKKLTQGLVAHAEQLKPFAEAPILKMGTESLQRAGEGFVRTAAHTLDQKAQRFDNAAFTLERMIQMVSDRRTQQWRLLVAAGAGVILGAVLLLFLPRLLPFNADSYVAAGIMGKPRWEAGAAVMNAANPEGWGAVTENAKLGQDNTDGLARCRQAAVKSGQTQKCMVRVTPARD
jgi:hypothetical protein